MRFPNSFLEDIRDRIPIADVVGRRVTFDRKKSNPGKGDFWGCCPFHGEKTPSFHCENQKGRYHCFGCGASGDHFRFLTELDGLSFPEAVERLADEAGLPMPAVDPQAAQREEKKASLYDVMALAAQFFRDQLQTAAGAKARAYLRDRGLSPAVQNTFGLGYAPNDRSALKSFLASKNVEKDKIEACGLVVFGPDIPVSYDRFRDRIMFPILDTRGRVIAFGGRALSADVPAKYLNSPETILFSKSNVLYNYSQARKACGRDESLIVTEGYMDVIALHAAGFTNAVAPLGTALTENQLELAWRVGKTPILCFDGDEAGYRAACRTLDLAVPKITSERSISFIVLSNSQDPDDFLKAHGKDAFLQAVDNAMPFSDFLIHRRMAEIDWSSPEGKARVEKSIYQDIYSIADKSLVFHLRAYARTRLSAQFYGRTEHLAQKPSGSASEILRQSSRLDSAILGFCVEYPQLLLNYLEDVSRLDFNKPKYNEFAQELNRLLVEFDELSVADIYKRISPVFYDVLAEVHGFENPKGVKEDGTIPWSQQRGHRLRAFFPALKSDTPFSTVDKTFQFLLKKFSESKFEKELLELSIEEGVDEFIMHKNQLEVFRSEIDFLEAELDAEYRAHAGKPNFAM
ncbi:DNA primase [Pseudahrensia aquimaris]|uniref:DNA primase n=1 Tax=Pseudahrensia aquimaris TaxID=744461 RepID=A0ABW3FCY5_9HYPH